MTARQVYEAVLIEMNKVQAPSILLEDFNYFFNKAILQYINKRYNIYDVNQQTTDDLRVLKATAILDVVKSTVYSADLNTVVAHNSLYGGTYETNMPLDYLHLLNCICNFKVIKNFKCYNKDTYVSFPATRLTSDLWSQVINNFYMRPSYKKPYYFIHNVNTTDNNKLSTNPYKPANMQSTGFGSGTDAHKGLSLEDLFPGYTFEKVSGYIDAKILNKVLTPIEGDYWIAKKDENKFVIIYDKVLQKLSLKEYTKQELTVNSNTINIVTSGTGLSVSDGVLIINEYSTLLTDNLYKSLTEDGLGLPRYIKTDMFGNLDLVEKEPIHRYGNASNVRLEIRFGKDDFSVFQLESVYVDYIKSPLHIRLTLEEIDLIEDTSQIMEFPDYVCQEIINELTHTLMENSSDPRLLTHMPISMSIANPAQQLEQPKK